MPFPGAFLIFAVLAILMGLWEVKGQVTALPGWYWGWATLVGGTGVVSVWTAGLALENRPRLQRIMLHGFGWGFPVMALLAGPKLLKGEFRDPALVLLFVSVWSVGSFVYGGLTLPKRPTGDGL